MSRKPRELSENGIYHLIARGNDKAMIFIEESDCMYFLKCLQEIAMHEDVNVHCYCLMGNHFHLLVKMNNQDSPARFMKRIGIKYVYYFNHKYNRIGSLFQDRYKSECIDDEAYYLTVFRYILRNPVKAGITRNPFDYVWSSAKDLYNGVNITALGYTFDIMPREELINYINNYSDDVCIDVDEDSHITSDSEATSAFQAKYVNTRLIDVRRFDDEAKKIAINLLHNINCSIRQISRLTSIPRGVVRRLIV